MRRLATSDALFTTEDSGPGFRLHVHRTKAFKTVSAKLVLHADLDGATAARALVPRVLARGTRRLPSLRDLQIELDRLYGAGLSGDARKMGERQLVQFRADWVHDRLAGEPLLEKMGALFAEMLYEPAVDDEGMLRGSIVEQERKMMADEAAAIFDDKARYARHRLIETMCKEEPYARPSIGRLAEIQALDRAMVQRAYEDLLARAPADLFLVGDVTRAAARRFAKRLRLHDRPAPRRLRRTVRKAAGRVRTITERQEVAQAKLAMGFRTKVRLDGPGYAGHVLMNALFGGLPTSRLFKIVREKASLCYSIHSMTERAKGLLLVLAGIEAENYARARKLSLAQLEALRSGEIGKDELAMAKGTLTSSLRALRDTAGGLIDFALERAVMGIDPDLDLLLLRIERTTAADVARAARAVTLDTVFLLKGR
jgi:predicted Zn-dependent peptidase